ncbi:hypothetical protein ROLI_026010 [Roseobacter fucihabitans]|uniref:Lipoprotein n=1 Tax=Roseobacter fucihabitans TaxID=1537242 RepID=A0ABZ2BUJ4_9RHOB|nr:hypothetical protein [Roseobacter litoralis]MBC6965664.1 hypothetical protein [Roseobacter litoralis]
MHHRTYRNAPILGLGVALSVLSACGEAGGSFYREAGAQLDADEFGKASLQNMIAQTCTTAGSGVGKAGAAPADPIVALDPVSTSSNPVYRVYCDGRLDGKYAQVIYAEYIESATQKTITDDVEAE